MAQSDFITIQTTMDSIEAAESLSQGLLESRLCACVKIIPGVFSSYWWDGEIDHSEECLLTITTTQQRVAKAKRYIIENHEYETPEIIVIPIIDGSKDYLEWIKNETSKDN